MDWLVDGVLILYSLFIGGFFLTLLLYGVYLLKEWMYKMMKEENIEKYLPYEDDRNKLQD